MYQMKNGATVNPSYHTIYAKEEEDEKKITNQLFDSQTQKRMGLNQNIICIMKLI